MTFEFIPGRLPNDPAKPRLRFAAHLDAAAAGPPPSADFTADAGVFPMDGNDRVGDCTIAGWAHELQVQARYGSSLTLIPAESDVIATYSAISGYSPAAGPAGNNPTDTGCVMQDVAAYRRKVGMAGHRSLAFGEVDVHDETHVKAATYVFGGVQIGVNLPASAMDQFNRGQRFDVVARDGGILGGHDIYVAGYTVDGDYLGVTWGRVVRMSSRWLRTYCEEAWATVEPLWLGPTGQRTPAGLDLYGIGAELAALTGQANPFPQNPPVTPPVTPPVVPPAPAGDPVDVALAAAVRPWVGKRHTGGNAAVARAVKAWLAAKGL